MLASISAVLLTVATEQGPPPVSAWVPWREEHVVSARCQEKAIRVHYVVARPGPDMFISVTIGSEDLPPLELGRLNDMLGGYMLDHVSIYSCPRPGPADELKLYLHLSKGEERHISTVAIGNGKMRLIR